MISSINEQILVVKRSNLFTDHQAWHGVDYTKVDEMITNITAHQEYIDRSIAENNPEYKQIIPYLIFTYAGNYFVMERRKTASEQRLAGKLSIGIGGHMRKEDIQGQTIFDWAQREFEEEVFYEGELSIKTLGILNDDTNEVGQVHLGLVLLLQGDNHNISIKDEHKNGYMLSKQACLDRYHEMESWSQLVLQIVP